MVFGVLSYPGVAVVDVHGSHILVGKVWKDHKPLGQEVRLKAVTGAYMGEVYYDLVVLGIVWFESQKDVVDQKIPIDLSGFEPKEK